MDRLGFGLGLTISSEAIEEIEKKIDGLGLELTLSPRSIQEIEKKIDNLSLFGIHWFSQINQCEMRKHLVIKIIHHKMKFVCGEKGRVNKSEMYGLREASGLAGIENKALYNEIIVFLVDLLIPISKLEKVPVYHLVLPIFNFLSNYYHNYTNFLREIVLEEN